MMIRYIGWTNCTPPYTAVNAVADRSDLDDPVCFVSVHAKTNNTIDAANNATNHTATITTNSPSY
jgi:hypothetical protein